MVRFFFVSGAILALTAVAAGAFGSHVLRGRLSKDLLETFEIAVRYQMYHALALLAVAWWATRVSGAWVTTAGICFLVGVLIFSGSLYILVSTGHRWLGAVTPIGGTALLLGWLSLVVSALMPRNQIG